MSALDGHNGQTLAGGWYVRLCRCPAIPTHSPSRASYRTWELGMTSGRSLESNRIRVDQLSAVGQTGHRFGHRSGAGSGGHSDDCHPMSHHKSTHPNMQIVEECSRLLGPGLAWSLVTVRTPLACSPTHSTDPDGRHLEPRGGTSRMFIHPVVASWEVRPRVCSRMTL